MSATLSEIIEGICSGVTDLSEGMLSGRQLAHAIVAALGRNQRSLALSVLEVLADEPGDSGLTREWVQALIAGLRTSDWRTLRRLHNQVEMRDGVEAILLAGPYTRPHWDRTVTKPLAIYATIDNDLYKRERGLLDKIEVSLHTAGLDGRGQSLRYVGCRCGRPVYRAGRESVLAPINHLPDLLPLSDLARSGANCKSQVLIDPRGWDDLRDDSGRAPTLLDCKELQRQFADWIPATVPAIFERETANFLLAPFRAGVDLAEHYRAQLVHHVSRYLGRGIQTSGVPTLHLAATEKFRWNGLALDIAARVMDNDEYANFVRAGWCLRFGVDSYRPGGIKRDSDVLAALIEFAHLLQSGCLIDCHDKLAFRDLSVIGLRCAVEPMIASARTLTSRAQADDGANLPWIHNSIAVPPGIDLFFERAIRSANAGKDLFSVS
jgi:hypothetical protein